jgi:hypothetical protein
MEIAQFMKMKFTQYGSKDMDALKRKEILAELKKLSIILSSVMGTLIWLGIGIEADDTSYKKIMSETQLMSEKTLMPEEKPMPGKNEDNLKHQSDKVYTNDPKSYHHVITSTSEKYNMESSLVYAVIEVESNWDSKAVSHKGATGLMQLMPSTVKAMKVKNPFDPEENIEGGIRYIRYLLDRFNGDITLTLAAYNSGPTTVRRFKGMPPIKETKQFVKKVLSIEQYYKALTENQNVDNTIYTIQTGSFSEVERAQKQFESIMQILNRRELEYLRIEKVDKYYCVRLGKFEGYSKTEKLLQAINPKLSKAIIMEAYMIDERIIRLHKDSISADS